MPPECPVRSLYRSDIPFPSHLEITEKMLSVREGTNNLYVNHMNISLTGKQYD